MTIMPIPPIHCIKPRHSFKPSERFSIPISTVEPVVVIAETDSKTALVKLSWGAPRISGRLAKQLILVQLPAVRINICQGFSSSDTWRVSTQVVNVALKIMSSETAKAGASASFSITNTIRGSVMNIASTSHNTDMILKICAQLR
jgi:hypothetical protein